MPVHQAYFRQVKGIRIMDPDAVIIAVSPKIPDYVDSSCYDYHFPVLSPSEDLTDIWYSDNITWTPFQQRYIDEMNASTEACHAIDFAANIALERHIFVVSPEGPRVYGTARFCYRFALRDLIEKRTSGIKARALLQYSGRNGLEAF